MQLDAIDIFHVAIPLRSPLRSSPEPSSEIQTVLVRLASGGAFGWGEAPVGGAPLDSAEWAGGVFLSLRDWLAPAVVGAVIDSGAQLQQRLNRFVGNSFAKSALDIAWWNLNAQKTGKPLVELFGGGKTEIPVAVELQPLESIDELLTTMQTCVDRGLSRFHLLLRPGWDIEVLRAVRQCFSSHAISVGCAGQLSLDQRDFFYRLEDFHLAYIEQPLDADDIVGHAMLQESLRTPVALRQSLTSLNRLRQAIDLGAARHFVIAPGRAGGATPALEILSACRDASIGCTVASLPQSIVSAHCDLNLCGAAPVSTWQLPWEAPADEALLAWPTLLTSDGHVTAQIAQSSKLDIDPTKLTPLLRAHARLG
jgi:o-succinylbenzoate synthase